MSIEVQIARLKRENVRKKREDDSFYSSSPWENAKHLVKEDLAKRVEYRVGILKDISAFVNMSNDELIGVAQRMDESIVPYGTEIITQDEHGDTFYIIEEGEVSVTRRLDPRNSDEIPGEVARLGKNSVFGEMSLLTSELRSASVTVVSNTAKVLQLTKQVFDELLSANADIRAKVEAEMVANVLKHCSVFASLGEKERQMLLDSMKTQHFPPNTVIIKEGSVGKRFYIILSGTCTVSAVKVKSRYVPEPVGNIVITDEDDAAIMEGIRTTEEDRARTASPKAKQRRASSVSSIMSRNKATGPEGEILNTLHPGDFCGEVALMSKHKDPCNASVIAVDNVTCMTLERSEFLVIFKNMENALASLHAHHHVSKEKKEKIKNHDAHKQRHRRRVTGIACYNVGKDGYVDTILKRMAKFMSDSLYNSQYQRLFRDILLRSEARDEYGAYAKDIAEKMNGRADGVQSIRAKAMEILNTDPELRTSDDIHFIYGLMRQHNKFFESKYCAGWSILQMVDLCRFFSFQRHHAISSVVKVNQTGSTMFIILRGAARVLAEHIDPEYGRMKLVYEEDLCAGEMFGEVSLEGLHHRTITVQALTELEVVVLEHEHYISARGHGVMHTILDAGEKYRFISGLPMFKNSNKYVMSRFAHALAHEEIIKGNVVMEKGKAKRDFCFILNGCVDLVRKVPPSDVATMTVRQQMESQHNIIASLRQGDFFGESGTINCHFEFVADAEVAMGLYKKFERKVDHVVECCDAIAATHVEVLEISAIEARRVLDKDTLQHLISAFESKCRWRKSRAKECKSQVKSLRSRLNKEALVRNTSVNFTSLPKRTESEDGLWDGNSVDDASLVSFGSKMSVGSESVTSSVDQMRGRKSNLDNILSQIKENPPNDNYVEMIKYDGGINNAQQKPIRSMLINPMGAPSLNPIANGSAVRSNGGLKMNDLGGNGIIGSVSLSPIKMPQLSMPDPSINAKIENANKRRLSLHMQTSNLRSFCLDSADLDKLAPTFDKLRALGEGGLRKSIDYKDDVALPTRYVKTGCASNMEDDISMTSENSMEMSSNNSIGGVSSISSSSSIADTYNSIPQGTKRLQTLFSNPPSKQKDMNRASQLHHGKSLPSLLDIPKLLNQVEDPIQVISTCKSVKEAEKLEKSRLMTRKSKHEHRQHLKKNRAKHQSSILQTVKENI